MILTFIQPFKYSTEARMMLVQDFAEGTDPYTMARTNEFLSGVLSRVVLSNSFFDAVMESGYNISSDYFPISAGARIEKWKKTVDVRPLDDTGIINVVVFHPDKYQAEQIVRAINFTLQNKHTDYHSGSKNLEIKIIDKPVVSDFPVKPNILLNAGLALGIGLIISFCYVYLFPDEKYNIRFLPRKKKFVNKETKTEKTIDNLPIINEKRVAGVRDENHKKEEIRKKVLEEVDKKIQFLDIDQEVQIKGITVEKELYNSKRVKKKWKKNTPSLKLSKADKKKVLVEREVKLEGDIKNVFR